MKAQRNITHHLERLHFLAELPEDTTDTETPEAPADPEDTTGDETPDDSEPTTDEQTQSGSEE